MVNENTNIRERLAAMETKLDILLTITGERAQDHETRIRSAEKKIYIFSGIAASFGATFDTILKKIGIG